MVISEDTDVFMLLLALEAETGGHLLLRRGKQNKTRIVDISRLATIITLTIALLRREMPDFISPNQWPSNSPDMNPVDYKIWAVM